MRVSNEGAKRKLKAMQSFQVNFPQFIRDAAAYLNAKIVDSILNGAPGEDYPKPYPAGVSEGVGGYVGVVTSNLRRSIGITIEDGGMVARISQTQKALASYHDDILLWTEQRYGLNFYQMAVSLYGENIAVKMLDFIKRMVIAANQGKTTRYRNEFGA